MMPLTMVNNGNVKVLSIRGGRGTIQRLSSMGIIEGSIINVVYNPGRGPIIIQMGNSRFAIGYGMARRVFVTPIEKFNQGGDYV